MTEAHTADVIVVGAGTAGCLLAWRLAEQGCKVTVLEMRCLNELGRAIEIIHMEKSRFAEFGIPLPEPPELIHTEEVSYTWSPDLAIKVPVGGTFYVLNMPAFIQRLQGCARQAGVTFIEEAAVDGVILEGGRVVGVRGTRQGAGFEARARLVVDASGLAGAVRTRLPDNFGVEYAPVPADKCLYVCLELRADIPPGYPIGSNGYLYHKSFWNKSYGDDVVLGMGQPHSFEHAWEKHRAWREAAFGNPGRLVGKRQGAIPFTRTPYSLVGNGLMIVGDAANQNKPFSGEGITSGFTAAVIAAEVAGSALAAGEATLQALWPYNVRYQRGQGAKFAASLAQLPATVELSERDVNFLFRKGIIFTSEDFEELNRSYEIAFSTSKLARIALVLVGGVISGKFSGRSLATFLGASSLAGKVKKHYQHFPDDPAGFEAWAAAARRLWNEQPA